MKKITTLMSCCILTLTASMASAAGGYISGKMGASMVPDLTNSGNDQWGSYSEDLSFEPGIALTGALGYNFGAFRAEAEIGYQKNDLDEMDWTQTSQDMVIQGNDEFSGGDLTTTTFFVNGYYDIATGSAFTPYIGAGLGYAKIELSDLQLAGADVFDSTRDDSVFAYQFMLGSSYALNQNLAIDLSYRYVGTSDSEFGDKGNASDFEFSSHNILLGIRYTF